MGSWTPGSGEVVDVLIIGAGLSGICALHHVRKQFPQWRVKVLEAGEGPGGTWYWNRYPGARFDSESISYAYSWDQDILDEWHWKEAFSPQPETLKYIERVCEKNDLYRNIQFNTRIKAAQWQDAERTWLFSDTSGSQYASRFFVSCIGFLSEPTLPAIPGIESFKGKSFHTSRWPKNLVASRDFAGKRVGVIGTGATGIQTITALSKEPSIKSLHVFQRTANWSAPLRNSEISTQEMEQLKNQFDDMFRLCSETPMGFIHQADKRNSLDVSEEERLALWERLYAKPGFGKWLGNFSDTYTDRRANEMYSEFMASKIRSRVLDPEVAESLIPKNHGFGTRRVPLESGYFEAYNKDNVHLVDLQKTPIQKITSNCIVTSDDKEHELDVLVYATGFDAITGAFGAIDWQAKGGRPLLGSSEDKQQAVWVDHKPRTFLGLTAPSMPNTFMILGPHQPFGNATRSIEHAAQVLCDLLQYVKDKGFVSFEPTEDAVEAWTEHVFQVGSTGLVNEVESWMTGVNRNVKGKTERTVARYAGSAVDYRRRCEECKNSGWQGLHFE